MSKVEIQHRNHINQAQEPLVNERVWISTHSENEALRQSGIKS